MTKYELALWCSGFQEAGFPNIGDHEYVIMGHGIGKNGRGNWQFVNSSGVRSYRFYEAEYPKWQICFSICLPRWKPMSYVAWSKFNNFLEF